MFKETLDYSHTHKVLALSSHGKDPPYNITSLALHTKCKETFMEPQHKQSFRNRIGGKYHVQMF